MVPVCGAQAAISIQRNGFWAICAMLLGIVAIGIQVAL